MEEYVKLAQKGDIQAFEKLIEHYKIYLYNIAISIVHTENDAGDAIAETILNAYKYLHKLKKVEFFKTWLTRILINECKKIIKKRKNDVSIEECEETLIILDNNTDIDEKISITNAINSLKKELKIVLILFYYNELSIKDISNILTIPEGTVKSRLNTAKTQLKDLLIERGIK